VIRSARLRTDSVEQSDLKNPTFHPTYQTDTTGPNRHHRTKNSDIFGPIRRHRTSPTDCSHLIIPRSWVRSPPALLIVRFLLKKMSTLLVWMATPGFVAGQLRRSREPSHQFQLMPLLEVAVQSQIDSEVSPASLRHSCRTD